MTPPGLQRTSGCVPVPSTHCLCSRTLLGKSLLNEQQNGWNAGPAGSRAAAHKHGAPLAFQGQCWGPSWLSSALPAHPGPPVAESLDRRQGPDQGQCPDARREGLCPGVLLSGHVSPHKPGKATCGLYRQTLTLEFRDFLCRTTQLSHWSLEIIAEILVFIKMEANAAGWWNLE